MATTATSNESRPVSGPSAQARRRSPAKKAAPTTAAGPQPTQVKEVPPASEAARPEAGSELVTWQDVPMPHVKVPVVHVAGPAARSVLTNVRWTTRTLVSAVPEPKSLLYYGGVGALAALGMLEWPVAVAAAAGVWVATHTGRRAESQGPAEAPEGERRATAGPATATAR
jgi:hypothetical protein